MSNFKSLQSLLGVPSSFEDEEPLYSKMPTKEEELEAYTSTPKWSAEQYKQSITPKHREELERQQKARERTEEFEKTLSEDMGPIGALGYHVLKNIAFDERPPSEFEESGGGVYESTSPIDFVTPPGLAATGKGIASLLGKKPIPKGIVSEILPAKKFQRIKQTLPSSTVEGKVVTPQLAAEERLALPAPATEEPLGLPMPKQEPPIPSAKSIEVMPMAESPVALEQAVEAETPAIVSSKPIARAKKSTIPQELEPDKFVIPGMFLKTEQLIRQKMGKSATPQQIMGVLREAKPEELEYLQIPQFLEGQDKITKEALLEHIRRNSEDIKELKPKTLNSSVEKEKLDDELIELRKEKNEIFPSMEEDRRELERELAKSGYSNNQILEIIESLDNKNNESLEKFKNIAPNVFNIAKNYQNKILRLNEIEQNLTNTKEEINKISSSDLSLKARYYNHGLRNLVLEHPKSQETYKERLFTISPPKRETREEGKRLTAEGAKLYDAYEEEIKELEKKQQEAKIKYDNFYKETREKDAVAWQQNREKDEIFKNEAIKYFDTRYPSNIGTPFDGTNTVNRVHKRIFNELFNATTLKGKLSLIDSAPIPEVLKTFYKENILSDENYLNNLEVMEKTRAGLRELDSEVFYAKQNKETVERQRNKEIEQIEPRFYSSHWEEPDVFAHTRSTEFTAPNGERHLFAQELQSDWHQKIRDLNKKLQKLEKKLQSTKLKEQNKELHPKLDTSLRIQQKIDNVKKQLEEMPKAPMGKNWHEFLTKRLLKEAADNDFDNISWTTGDTQNDRYNLENYFDAIEYNEESGTLHTWDLDGNYNNINNVSPEDLPDYVGEEISKKLLELDPNENGTKALSDKDLKAGGEGMRGFYDEIIPSTMAKFGKKYGVKPEKVMMPDVGEIWTMKLTPEMKEYIKKYGFPLFMLPGFMQQQEEAPEQKKEFNNINKLVKDKK